jgi:hypothetical protein
MSVPCGATRITLAGMTSVGSSVSRIASVGRVSVIRGISTVSVCFAHEVIKAATLSRIKTKKLLRRKFITPILPY